MIKKLRKFLCNQGFHSFKIIKVLNSYNSHLKEHIGLIAVGNLDMPIEFEHKKCRYCGFEINEIEEYNLEANDNVQDLKTDCKQ
jgi:hypothetical protein